MVTAIPANQITLYDLRVKFGLERTDDEQFFQEWQDDLPELTELEKKELKEIKRDYLHLSERPMVETIVKMVVLSPLLKLAGFYRHPFYITAEKVVEITSQDQETIITGRLDLLIYTPEFWVLVIEAKRADYSLEVGIPQALSYMLGNIESERPAFGFITNGPDFIFLKLSKDNTPKYGESDSFSLRNKTGLEQVLKILKRFNQLLSQ
ncbi:MAG: restriction endonuclease subunit R [Moorea sp. SIO1F2]|nr:restriction endonuclease subunit R [Moorena sp. SIO1F2]